MVFGFCDLDMFNNQDTNGWQGLLALPLDSRSHSANMKSTKRKMLAEYEEKTGKNGGKRQLSRIPLWYFLHEILEVEQCKELATWEDSSKLIFTIRKPKEVAVLWGMIKNKETMTYPKLARGIRYYYGKGVIEKYRGKRFSYQFVLSKKTKAVLTKTKRNLAPTEDKSVFTKSNLKRKNNACKDADVVLKRRRSSASTVSTDSFDAASHSDLSSEDEDGEFGFEEDWNSLDACLAEIFNDATRMKEIFSDEQTPPQIEGHGKSAEKEIFDDPDIFNFCREFEQNDIRVAERASHNTPYIQNSQNNSVTGNNFYFDQSILYKERNIYERTPPAFSTSYSYPIQNTNNQQAMTKDLCKSVPDFSVLETMFHNEQENHVPVPNSGEKDTLLQDLEQLLHSTYFM
ncbi:uncharacterized protein LOC130662318 [Hydractinia symbiolongicarpus]|uniref:uncharacterized protein LOC130662318 n=1 Tax=Hydractinia symbiolongicarpus TaxID=13093 RepID=UPI00254E4936|nr:uncharacterized protein LOC130662318 [Hydractinia symbiolongicarpus]XP_057317132.1 uncharacterized protein LOC130662318 [Hydractinia symbiolongicarpus]